MKQILWFIAITTILFSCEKPNKKLPSGHPYYHLVDHQGNSAKEGDIVEYHFIQRNKEGVIYSTYEEGIPKKFRIPKIAENKNDKTTDKEIEEVSPLTEAMMLMSEEDSLVLEVRSEFLPPQLDGTSNGEPMFFDIKMIKITTAEEIEKEAAALIQKGEDVSVKMKNLSEQYKKGELKELEELETIQYKVEEKGTGKKLESGDVILVHFSGYLLSTGQKYLDTYSQKKPYQLKIGANRAIEAWEQILPLCSGGDKLYMFVPYQKAYGVAGSPGLGIPEKSDLAIYMEIVGFK